MNFIFIFAINPDYHRGVLICFYYGWGVTWKFFFRAGFFVCLIIREWAGLKGLCTLNVLIKNGDNFYNWFGSI